MTKLTDLEFLQLSIWGKIWYKIASFFLAIPQKFMNLLRKIGRFFVKCGLAIANEAKDIVFTFVKGDWKTKVSYLVLGFGCLARGQILRGILFLLFEVVFVVYMVLWGGHWLAKFTTLGTQTKGTIIVDIPGFGQQEQVVEGDDSFKILLYGLLTVLFIIGLIYTWRVNVKQNKIAEEILATGKPLKSGKDDLKSLVDDQFHKTLLALPLTGIMCFTVLPILFMILVAFTSYDGAHDGYNNLFHWVGMDNFNALFNWGGKTSGLDENLSSTFGEILGWTLIWAFFATFTNYFLGMAVAMAINKKGIRFKKLWRGILVLTSAVPQFVSLLYISKMFAYDGLVNVILYDTFHWMEARVKFWDDTTTARVLVILINIWIGIPYLMLITTGVLMNIPADMYESARIDGANPWQSFRKITVPYMFFVTGPYLLTSFTGNLNNFNVIFLLTGGGPVNPKLLTSGGQAGDTDLLITWLFNITTGTTSNYKLASVIGILIFLVVAFLSLVVYNLLPSNKNEEDYS